MNDIVIINGSPKAKDSVSGIFIDKIGEITGDKIPVYQATQFIKMESAAPAIADILSARILLIVFPLYVDSLPAPLIKVLGMIEQVAGNAQGRLPRVYAICNCGFFEADHTRLALDMVENFSARAGLPWGYGIGVGGGAFFAAQSKNMAKGGPAAAAYAALRELCEAMRSEGAEGRNIFITPKIPRFLYKSIAEAGWRRAAGKYGAAKFLNARPHGQPPS